MSEDERSNSQADGNKIIFPDLAELWKEIYFKTEGAWAEACKEFVSTETFVKMLDQTLNQHLSIEKITRQNLDRIYEVSSLPSKKDLARIAELVISVEEKVDNLDFQLVENINKMADSLLGMLKLMEKNQEQLKVIEAQNTELQNQIQAIKKQNADMKKQITALKNLKTESSPGSVSSSASNEDMSPKAKSSRKNNKSSKSVEQT